MAVDVVLDRLSCHRVAVRAGTPQLTAEQAIAILDRHWGITADRVVDLGSYEDQNLRVDAGAERYVLKVAGPSDARPPLEAEHRGAGRRGDAGARDAGRRCRHVHGAEIVDVDGHRVRLLSWVEGLPLTEVAHLDEPTLRELGAVAAASSAALADVRPARAAGRVEVGSAAGRARSSTTCWPTTRARPRTNVRLLLAATAPLRSLLAARRAELPALQTIHGDVTDYNVLVTAVGPGRVRISGLIDFGDSTRTWRIADLANACVAVVCRELEEPLHALLAVVAGYNELAPLDAVELDALWPLILGRAAACAALSTRQLRLTPDSEYTVAQYAGDWRAMRTLIGLPARPAGRGDPRPLRTRAGAGRPAGANC